MTIFLFEFRKMPAIDLLTMTTKSNLIAFLSETSRFYRQICLRVARPNIKKPTKQNAMKNLILSLSFTRCVSVVFFLSLLFLKIILYKLSYLNVYLSFFLDRPKYNDENLLTLSNKKSKRREANVVSTKSNTHACVYMPKERVSFFLVAYILLCAALSAIAFRFNRPKDAFTKLTTTTHIMTTDV